MNALTSLGVTLRAWLDARPCKPRLAVRNVSLTRCCALKNIVSGKQLMLQLPAKIKI